jgi:hypothetical protein
MAEGEEHKTVFRAYSGLGLTDELSSEEGACTILGGAFATPMRRSSICAA